MINTLNKPFLFLLIFSLFQFQSNFIRILAQIEFNSISEKTLEAIASACDTIFMTGQICVQYHQTEHYRESPNFNSDYVSYIPVSNNLESYGISILRNSVLQEISNICENVNENYMCDQINEEIASRTNVEAPEIEEAFTATQVRALQLKKARQCGANWCIQAEFGMIELTHNQAERLNIIDH